MSTPKPDLKWYVYMLSRPTGEPFYIGKGQTDRMQYHEWLARSADTSEKSYVIRKIWAAGGEIIRTVVARFATDQESRAFEVAEIARLGRKDLGRGPLVNRTDGGDGNDYASWSDEARAKHRQSTRDGMVLLKDRCREHMLRQRTDPAICAKMDAAIRAHWAKPESRRAQSERTRKFAQENPEVREVMLEKQRVALASPEVRAKMRAAKLGKKQSPEVIAKRVAILKGRTISPEARAKIGAKNRGRKKSPDTIAKHKEALRQSWLLRRTAAALL